MRPLAAVVKCGTLWRCGLRLEAVVASDDCVAKPAGEESWGEEAEAGNARPKVNEDENRDDEGNCPAAALLELDAS